MGERVSDLGVAKAPNGPRVYRKADVERVLRIKHLVFVDGLTLAGARKRLAEERVVASSESVEDADVAALIDDGMRQQLHDLRRGLHWILDVLSDNGVTPADFVLKAASPDSRPSGARASEKSKSAKTSKPTAKTARAKKR